MNVEVPAGISTVITGPNGVGKSALALTLAGLLPQLDGQVMASSSLVKDVPDPTNRRHMGLPTDPHCWTSEQLLTRLGTVFQQPEHQFVTDCVRDELAVGLRAQHLPASDVDARVDELLATLHLEPLADANPFTLSGGEQRRLSVGTVLAASPEVIVLDEPTFGQDRATWCDLVRLIIRLLDEGRTVISVTHDEDFIEVLGEHEVALGRGCDLSRAGRGAERPSRGPAAKQAERRAGIGASLEDDGGTVRRSRTAVGNVPATKDPDPGPGADGPGVGVDCREIRAKEAILAGFGRISRQSTSVVTNLDRLNPVARLVFAVLLAAPVLITLDWVSALVMLGLEVVIFGVLGVSPVDMLRRLWPVAIVGVIAGISMALYARPDGVVFWHWWVMTVSERSVMLALAIFCRILALALAAIVLLGRVDPTPMADALAQLARLPAHFVLGTLAGVRMLGLMAADWRSLGLARRARGLGDGRAVRRVASMAFGLLVMAIRRGARLATAMEVRGFSADAAWRRTWARESRLSGADFVGLVVCLIVAAVSLGAAVLAGTFWFIWTGGLS